MNGDLFNVLTDFLPLIEKYSEIDIKDLHIRVEKFNTGVTIKILSSSHEVADALSEIMLAIPKMVSTDEIDFSVSSKNFRTPD